MISYGAMTEGRYTPRRAYGRHVRLQAGMGGSGQGMRVPFDEVQQGQGYRARADPPQGAQGERPQRIPHPVEGQRTSGHSLSRPQDRHLRERMLLAQMSEVQHSHTENEHRVLDGQVRAQRQQGPEELQGPGGRGLDRDGDMGVRGPEEPSRSRGEDPRGARFQGPTGRQSVGYGYIFHLSCILHVRIGASAQAEIHACRHLPRQEGSFFLLISHRRALRRRQHADSRLEGREDRGGDRGRGRVQGRPQRTGPGRREAGGQGEASQDIFHRRRREAWKEVFQQPRRMHGRIHPGHPRLRQP